ncbi:MAG: PKD domain-containing protein [Candidatus Woesearchaeota archaeon]
MLMVFAVLLSGVALAGTELWVRGSFGAITDVVTDKTVARGESVTYSGYAQSDKGSFTLETFVSQCECDQMKKDLNLANEESVYNDKLNEAGIDREQFDTSTLSPDEYYLCLFAKSDSDKYTDIESLTLTVENNDPEFTGLDEEYNLSLTDPNDTVVIDSLENYVSDDEGESQSFSVIGNTDPSVAECSILSGDLVCSPSSVGSTDVELQVTDEYGATDTQSVTINVESDSDNNAPYFEGLDTEYNYSVQQGQGNIFSVDLSDYGRDDDGDDLSYSFSESSSIIDCSLSGTTLGCEYIGTGQIGSEEVTVTVTDGIDNASEVITINLTDTDVSDAEAVIDAPSSAIVGSDVTFDGGDSTGSDGSEIVSYAWTIAGESYSDESVTRNFSSEGTYDVELSVTDENGKTDTAYDTINIYTPDTVDLEVNYIRIDGEKHDPYDKTDQILKVERGQKLPIKLKLSAHTDVRDVQVSAKIAGYEYSQYEQDKIFQMSDTFDLDENRWDTRELELQIPNKVATGDVKLRIYVEDRNSNSYVKEYNLDIAGVDDANAVQIRDAYLSPSNEVQPGRALSALVKVENFGDKPLDDVTLVAEVPELDIRDTETLDELDVDEVETFERTLLRFPKDAKPGDYEVLYTVKFDEYEKTVANDTVTIVEDNTTVTDGKTNVNVPDSQEVKIGGNGAVYPISITNNGDSSTTYRLSVKGVDSWGSYRIDPSSMIVVPAGETKTAYMYVSADEDQQIGVKEFQMDVMAPGATKRVALSAALVEGDSQAEDGLGDTLFIVLAVVIIVIILAAIIFGLSRMRSRPEDQDEDYY